MEKVEQKEIKVNQPAKIEVPLVETKPSVAPPVIPPEVAEDLTKAINTLIAKTVELIITLDEEECAKNSKYGKPCETCQSLAELKAPVRTIIRLSKHYAKIKEGV
jgi:hypothetical protein